MRNAATIESSTLAQKANQGESAEVAYLNIPRVSSGESFVTVGFEKRSSLMLS